MATGTRLRVSFLHGDEAVCSAGAVVDVQNQDSTLTFAQLLPSGRWSASLVDDVTGDVLCRCETSIEPQGSTADVNIKCGGVLGLFVQRAENDDGNDALHKKLKLHFRDAPIVRVGVADAFGNDMTAHYDIAVSLELQQTDVRVESVAPKETEKDHVLFQLHFKKLVVNTECLVEFAVSATPKAGGAAVEKRYKLRFNGVDVKTKANKFHIDLGVDNNGPKKEKKFKVDTPSSFPRVREVFPKSIKTLKTIKTQH